MHNLELVIVGLTLGLVAIVPPGPISLTLVEVGSARGRHTGVRAALGVATGEAVGVAAAVILVGGLGAAIAGSTLTLVRLVSALAVVALGLALLARPDTCRALAVALPRPGLSMLAVTLVSPSVVGGWVALLAVVPVAGGGIGELALVGVGGVVASLGWHVALGAGAGSVGRLLSVERRRRLTRAGGAAMIGFAAVSVAL